MKISFLLVLLFLCSTSTVNAHAAIVDFLNEAKAASKRVNEASNPANRSLSTTSLHSYPKSSSDNSEEITPFADIAWENSLFIVIEKIQKMSADRLVARIGNEEVNLMQATDKDKIIKKLEQLVQNKAGDPKKIKASGLLRSYLDKNGNKLTYVGYAIEIEAKGINIFGIAYELKATFLPSPGVAIQSPNNIYMHNTFRIIMPLGLQEISLTSHSPRLKEKYKAVNSKLLSKYNRSVKDQRSSSHDSLQVWNDTLSGSTSDGLGHSITIDSNSTHSYITYSYTGFEHDFSEIYRAHLSRIEANQTSQKSDMGNSF